MIFDLSLVPMQVDRQPKSLNNMVSKYPFHKDDMESTRKDGEVVKKVTFAPPTVKSEPNTPIYATVPTTEEAPDYWFAPISYREYLAVMTMESIPNILLDMAKDHTVSTPTQFFSPRLLPLLDRMKFYFSRAMAFARYEAVNGVFDMRGIPGTNYRDQRPITECDVMSSLQIEAFLAGIEEIKSSEEGERVVFRRYWRILDAPADHRPTLGGVISTGSKMEHHVKVMVNNTMQKHWDDTPKMLIAEFSVAPDGHSTAGRLLRCY